MKLPVRKAGARCSPVGARARSSTHVLECARNKKWAKVKTLAQARSEYNDSLATQQPLTPPALRSEPGGGDSLDGYLDVLRGDQYSIHVSGWVWDHDTAATVVVRITDTASGSSFDSGPVIADVGAETSRPDVPGGRGFELSLPRLAGSHWVCVTALNVPGTRGSDRELGCRTIEVLSDAPSDPLTANAGWLQTVNYYRTTSGVVPVAEDAARNGPIIKHLTYLRDTPVEYFVGPYLNLHSENPASPYYTPEGAGYSHNVLTQSSSERAAIESWMGAPFHAINLLNPSYNTAGFGMLGGRAAAITVATAPLPSAIGQPVMFPGNGSTFPLRTFRGESPDPRDPCPTPASWRGVPLIIFLPADPPSGASATMRLPDGSRRGPADVCVVTERNYVPSDPIYGSAGASILAGANAVLVIPRDPLTPGTHSVHVDLPGMSPVDWSFDVSR